MVAWARRGFIRGTTGLLVLGAGSTLLPRLARAAAGKYAIELDGIKAGWVWSVEGGQALLSKTDGGELLTIASDDPGSRLVEWMQPGTRRGGALIDPGTGERLEFTNALVTEVGMPALDAKGKDPAWITVKIRPEFTRKVAGPKLKPEPLAAAQKKWLPANFRIRIDGLDKGCARVNKIEAITIKQKVVEHAAEFKEPGKIDYPNLAREPGKIDYPNLVITLPESHADEFAAWARAYAAKKAGPRDGSLTLFAEDGLTAKYIVVLRSIRPLKLTPEKVESGSEQLRGTTRDEVELQSGSEPIRRVKVEMYCEEIRIAHAGA